MERADLRKLSFLMVIPIFGICYQFLGLASWCQSRASKQCLQFLTFFEAL
jgi:hypothetical protein